MIWRAERRSPALGEVGELAEARDAVAAGCIIRFGRDLAFVLDGVAAMAAGGTLLVEAVQRISAVEAMQTPLGLTLVGFSTGFALVMLAWHVSVVRCRHLQQVFSSRLDRLEGERLAVLGDALGGGERLAHCGAFGQPCYPFRLMAALQ